MDTQDLPTIEILETSLDSLDSSCGFSESGISNTKDYLETREAHMEELRKNIGVDTRVISTGIENEKVDAILPHDPRELKSMNYAKDISIGANIFSYQSCDNRPFELISINSKVPGHSLESSTDLIENQINPKTLCDKGDNNMKITASPEYTTDAYGRRNYVFSQHSVTLTLSVFVIGCVYMVRANDMVMALKEFLGIRHMYRDKPVDTLGYLSYAPYESYSSHDSPCTVLCDTYRIGINDMLMYDSPITFRISDTSVNLLIRALIIIGRDYQSDQSESR